MQFSKNTSTGTSQNFLIKITLVVVIFIGGVILFLVIVTGAVVLLGKIDFPSPNKEIEKTISNEKLKIVK